MPAFKHVLFPVDFSDRCLAVWPAVRSVARQFDAKLTLMHTIQLPIGWYGGVDASYAALADLPAMKEDVRRQLDSSFELSDPSCAIERIVEEGDPANCAVAYAVNHGVDLIMIPTHGRGTFRRLLLGSVTAKILHDSPCAVWTSAHIEASNTMSGLSGKSMVCAVDLSPESVGLIRHANDLARQCDAKLRLVHAVGGIERNAMPYKEMDFLHFLFQAGRDGVADLQREAGTSLEACIEGGTVALVVSDAARKLEADLVVMGRGKMHQALGRLRSNAYAIIRDSPCPVLSI